MQDSARTRHWALLGALAVLTLVTFVTGGVSPQADIAYAQSSSSCGGPYVLYYDLSSGTDDYDYACQTPEKAFCPGPNDEPQVWDTGTEGQVGCAEDYKLEFGYCPRIGEEMEYDFCAVVCCPAPDVGYIWYGSCPESDPQASEIVFGEDGDIDPYASCGGTSSSSESSSSSSVPLCGNGEIDEDEGEECDDGSWCYLSGDYTAIYDSTDMEDCLDEGGSVELTGPGDGCDDSCQLEDIYCCNEIGEREAVEESLLVSWAATVSGDYLTGYYCADISASLYPYSDRNLTETDPEASCFCGDGEVNGDEECDLGEDEDGNSYNTDENGCPDCVFACGDGYPDTASYVVEYGGTDWAGEYDADDNWNWYMEECDDGNYDTGDGCDDYCQMEPIWYCDFETGYREEVPNDVRPEVDVGYECDPENDPYLEGCYGVVSDDEFASCECGDGYVDYFEECDLGAEYNTLENGCTAECEWVCGNGNTDDAWVVNWEGDDWVMINGEYLVEECDDGNGYNNDGCDEFCQEEPGLCCFDPYDWPDYGYFEYEEDSVNGEEVNQEYCDYYGGIYWGPADLEYQDDFYTTCEIPGICCPSQGAPYEAMTSYDCEYGDFIDPVALQAGDYYGFPYDEDGDGSYNSSEASYACNENGVCCYDTDDDGTNDTYDYPTDEYDVDRDYCDEQGGVFTPLSAMDPEDPAEFCGIQGICCYSDGTQEFTDRIYCEDYYEQGPKDEFITGEYVTYDDVNTTDDYELTEEEIDAACNDYGLCCLDYDDDGTNDDWAEDVDRDLCEFFYGDFKPNDSLEDDYEPTEVCEIPGVCCWNDTEYYEDYDPERSDEDYCNSWEGTYYTFAEADANEDLEIDDYEMEDVCEYRGVCCIDTDENLQFDTYREDYTEEECTDEWEGEWTKKTDIPDHYESVSEYCPIEGVCCPSGDSQQDFDPFRSERYSCISQYEGKYLSFDEANTNEDDEISDEEMGEACGDPGFCCYAPDFEYDEVLGAKECTTPEEFRPTAGATDLNEDEEITWEEACAQYCCYANDWDDYGNPYNLESTNLAEWYEDYVAETGDDCQLATGDENMLGEVSETDENICTMYCCLEDEEGNREPYAVEEDYQMTPCEYQESSDGTTLKGGDEYGYPIYDASYACDYDEPVVCCNILGEEITFYDNELDEGDNCPEWVNEGDCEGPVEDRPDTCYQDMGAVLASDRQSSSDGSEPEPLCKFYCCDIYGDPYSEGVDPYSACEDQYDDFGDPLTGGDKGGLPVPDEDAACPIEVVYCCSGGTEVVPATDDGTEDGMPLEDSEGRRIKAGDSCDDFGAFEPFPAHDYFDSDFACDYYCCDAVTEEQVPVVAEDYQEAQGIYGNNPTCEDIAELTGSDWQDGPVGPPTECSNPTLYCCESAGEGPSGNIVAAYKDGEDVSGGYDDEDGYSEGCYQPNPTRSYAESGMTCCEGSADACNSANFCTTISLFGVLTLTACNPVACASNGCQPALEASGWLQLLTLTINNPWSAGLVCNVCTGGDVDDGDPVLFVCDGNGSYYQLSEEDAGMLFRDITFDNTEDAAYWCQKVNYSEDCDPGSIDILYYANDGEIPFFTTSYCP